MHNTDKEVLERRKEAEAREKQAYTMELVVNHIWPESRDSDVTDEEKSSPLSPIQSTSMVLILEDTIKTFRESSYRVGRDAELQIDLRF
ncbi:hypothetical protein FRC03_002304 [Tulasnella sp. 419]|nr:hypothetical protein FRC03_002304 [Tulasnella sp. 419]